jgi:hypothetical protein
MSTTHFAAGLAKPIAVGGVRFSHADYDEEADYLYLTQGIPLGSADGDTPEGHTLFLDENDRVICLLVNGARRRLERDGGIDVTLGKGGRTMRLERTVVEPLLVGTPRYT